MEVSGVTELEDVYGNADRNYRESLRLLGESVQLVQDFVDLYQHMFKVVAGSKCSAQDEYVMGTKFAMAARAGLVTAVADCLRCQLHDTFSKTRLAIEQVAFAARVKRHPHLAKVWLEAGHDDAAYDDYRKKFGKLFPADHVLLHELGDRYDVCAKQTHPSIYSFAGRSKIEDTGTTYTLLFDYFQADCDGSEPLRTFFWILNTHMLIVNVFREVLSEALANDAKGLEVHANSVEAKYFLHLGGWVDRIPALRPLVK
jgi:hypothetical protein